MAERKRFRIPSLLVLFLLLAGGALAADPRPEPFRDGDRVCFIGDSITHGGRYHAYIQLFYATRFPERDIEMFNCGISGDSAAGAVRRFDWDIGAHKPTVSTIMLGMNDVGRTQYGKENPDEKLLKRRQACLDRHRASMTKLAELLKAAGSRIIFITPSIYDQTSTMEKENLYGVNDALGICAGYARELAAEFGGSIVDFHGAMGEVNAKLQAGDPKATIVGRDRVHPGVPGHLIMAYLFLKAQGLSPVVSTTVIDAAGRKMVEAANCAVEDLSASPNKVVFTSIERALPFPLPKGAGKAPELVPFIEDLNQEILRVKGLAPGTYKLAIDGTDVGTYSAGDLAAGVNLAVNEKTPQYKQAQKVAAANRKRHSLTAGRLRSFVKTEIWLKRVKNLDMTDFEAVKKALNDRVAKLKERKSKYATYYDRQTKLYIEQKSKEPEYRRAIAEALEEMARDRKPVKHRFALTRKP